MPHLCNSTQVISLEESSFPYFMVKVTHHLLQKVFPNHPPSSQVHSQDNQETGHIAPTTLYFNNPSVCLFLPLVIKSLQGQILDCGVSWNLFKLGDFL